MFVGLVILILLDFPGSSKDSYKFYCGQVKILYESEFDNGIIVKNEIEINNHGVRDLVISTSNSKLIHVRIIDPMDWEYVDKLMVGESITKSTNSFVVFRKKAEKMNILTYCDNYFKTK